MWNPKYDFVDSGEVISPEYVNKLDDMLAYKNNIGWNLAKLADELGITGDLLRAVLTQEVLSEEIVNHALSLLKPLYKQSIESSKKQIAAREQKLKEDRFPEFSQKVRTVQAKAREQKIDLALLLGVSKRTFEKWLTGYSIPQGFTRVVLERLYEDYDKNIVLIMQLNPIKKT